MEVEAITRFEETTGIPESVLRGIRARHRKNRKAKQAADVTVQDASAPVETRHGMPRFEVRTDGGWTFNVPAPVAIVGISSLLLVGVLSFLEPTAIHAAFVERQAENVLRWETAERARFAESVLSMEEPLRDLRRQVLMSGLVPEGDLAPTTCAGSPADHFASHAGEAARLSAALAKVGGGAAEPLIPYKSPIDLAQADFAVTEASWLPNGVHVSSKKGKRNDPFTGNKKQHKGLDISAPVGTPVIAPASGTVVFAGSVDPNVDHYRSMLGNYVEIKHANSGFTSFYAHLSTVAVKKGQVVQTGDRLGAVGTTGRSTAPHLHYQIMRGSEAMNPLRFITDVVLVKDGKSVWYAKSSATARAE